MGGGLDMVEGLRVRHALLERLSRIQRSISHGAPLEEVFASIAAGASDLLGDPVAGLRLVDKEDPEAMHLVACVGLDDEQLRTVEHGRVGEGAGGRAIADNAVVVLEDYPDATDGIALWGAYGVRNALAAPVRVAGRVVGSLTVATYETGRRYGPVEQEVLAALAEHAGLALLDASLIDARERSVEERYQALVRNASDLIVIVGVDGDVTFATPSAGRALGVEPEALVGRPLLAHVHPDDRDRAAELLLAATREPGTRAPSEWRLVPSGGAEDPDSWMHVEVLATNLVGTPSIAGVVLNARDVTERVRAEQQRRERDALYRQIVDTTHDGVWMTDTQDRTVFANRALGRMLGRDPEELVGRPPTDFMPATAAGTVRAAMDRRRRGVADRYEATMQRADGTELRLAISGTPVFEDGRFSGALALCGDITELVAARGEKADLESQLRQAQEHAGLGRLAGQVAHDFNQVLSVILGYAELLRGRSQDARTLEDLDRIIEAGQHGSALARQLVTFSRRDAGRPEVIDLAELTRSTARLVATTAPPGVTVEAVADAPVPVRIDPTRMRQVLMNLVDNAFDALEDGGELLLWARVAGDGASLTVSDSGSGMPPDVVARALEPAYTTKPVGKGTGLGLAIVHGVVRGAGGRLSLDSTPGVGTTIEVLLPSASPEDAAAASPASDDPTGRPASPATILLVEDDAGVLALVHRLLTDQGYAVIAASDAVRGLAAAREHPIDLLLTDQTMPGATGLELAHQVAEVRPGTPAIVMSGFVAETAATRASGVDWLPKPFGAGALIQHVRDALARRGA